MNDESIGEAAGGGVDGPPQRQRAVPRQLPEGLKPGPLLQTLEERPSPSHPEKLMGVSIRKKLLAASLALAALTAPPAGSGQTGAEQWRAGEGLKAEEEREGLDITSHGETAYAK